MDNKDGQEYLLTELSEYSTQSNYKWLTQSVAIPVFNVSTEVMVWNGFLKLKYLNACERILTVAYF